MQKMGKEKRNKERYSVTIQIPFIEKNKNEIINVISILVLLNQQEKEQDNKCSLDAFIVQKFITKQNLILPHDLDVKFVSILLGYFGYCLEHYELCYCRTVDVYMLLFLDLPESYLRPSNNLKLCNESHILVH
jgi:hypothetical protein